jgi:hypothetical protein
MLKLRGILGAAIEKVEISAKFASPGLQNLKWRGFPAFLGATKASFPPGEISRF